MKAILVFTFSLIFQIGYGQLFVKSEQDTITQIKIVDGYYIENVFTAEKGHFVYSRGGFIHEGSPSQIHLEFNSNYESDSLRTIDLPNLNSFSPLPIQTQELDGAWLMGGRVRDGETQLRETSGPRKTLKLLFNGQFQWIAFHTETMRFLGTGGGSYTASKGQYIENIMFFSRDNTRVGASLSFDFEIIEGAWHHKGLSSKGQPIHEIWVKRTELKR